MADSTSPTSSGSSAEVISSSSSSSGSLTSARARATRCCWPPESRSGYFGLVGQAEAVEHLQGPGARPRPVGTLCARRGPSVTLSSTVRWGNRLNDWNTMPIRRRTALALTPAGGDVLAVEQDPAAVDRLEQVDAAQQRRLAASRSGR